MSIELLLDRSGQSNKFQKKSKKKFSVIQQMTPPKTCFEGPLWDVPNQPPGDIPWASGYDVPWTSFRENVRSGRPQKW